MKPIYTPKARAKEYGDLAINIYTGCNHGCYYCFAPRVLHKSIEAFRDVRPREGIVDAVKRQLDQEQITGKLIHLCFTCDPYPAPPVDTTPTREIIKAVKSSGNHVQILTKGDGRRDFDLLDGNDWYGVSYAGYSEVRKTKVVDAQSLYEAVDVEPFALSPVMRLFTLWAANGAGIKTWVSMEPIFDTENILMMIKFTKGYIDKYKIGKLNYHPSDIDWAEFGRKAEQICQDNGLDYYIKDDLRKEMENRAVAGGETFGRAD